MKRKHLILAILALLAAGGLWLRRADWRTLTPQTSSTSGDVEITNGQPTARHILRPPNPTQRFTDFTPEQRVEFARKGHGPGG